MVSFVNCGINKLASKGGALGRIPPRSERTRPNSIMNKNSQAKQKKGN